MAGAPVELEFTSRLRAQPDALWRWVTCVEGIDAELMPFLSMRGRDGTTSLAELVTETGIRPLDTDVLLGGVVPIGRARIEIVELGERRFVERSNQPGMALWQHERSVAPDGDGSLLIDRLRFTPKFAPKFSAAVIARLFRHRHARLRARWNGREAV